MIWKSMLIPSMGYVVGLILGFIVYRKPRVYEQRNVNDREKLLNSNLMLIVTVIAILATF